MSENTEAVNGEATSTNSTNNISKADTDNAQTPEVTEDERQDDSADDTKAQNAEAAKYRRKLRDAESELKAVTAQLDAVQRQQAESLIAASGVKPEAVWAVTELAGVLDDDGCVSAEKVAEAVTAAREKFGIAKPAKGSLVPGVGNQPIGNPRVNRWSEAFAPKR